MISLIYLSGDGGFDEEGENVLLCRRVYVFNYERVRCLVLQFLFYSVLWA